MSSLPSISSSSSTAALYTRSALLQWANRCLSTSYATLDAVPAMHVALLLNAIHGHNSFPLNRIDFSAPITGAAGSSLSSAARAAQLRNCEVVLSQARSHLGYEGRLSPSLWLAKEDTANELLFWRWVRQSAEGRGWAGSINAEGLMKSASITGNSFATTGGMTQQQQQQPQINSSLAYAEAFRADNFLSPTKGRPSHNNTSTSALSSNSGLTATANKDESAQPSRSKGPRIENEELLPSSSSLTSSIGKAVAHHTSSAPAAATITPTPTPQHISQQNSTYLQQTASSVPIGREAEAYHASLAMLTNHLHQQQNQQRQQMLMQQQQYEVISTTDLLALGTVPTDPYVAAIIDAKNEKLQFLQSIRARLIAACHSKDRSRVAELMCEYMRGGPSAQQQQVAASGAVDRMLI